MGVRRPSAASFPDPPELRPYASPSPLKGLVLRIQPISILVSLPLLFTTACGDGDGAAGSGKPDAGPALPDAAPAAPDAAPATPDAAPPPSSLRGLVLLGEVGGGGEGLGTAMFREPPLFGAPEASAAGCDLYDDMNVLYGAGYSAGKIAITGGASPMTWEPEGQPPYVYYQPNVAGDLYADGATLTVKADGGGFPAFTGTVTAPAGIAGFQVPEQISRANPPTLTWTSATADETWVWVLAGNEQIEPGEGPFLWCRTAGSDPGSYAIPAAGLALIPTNMIYAGVALLRVNTTDVDVGELSVELQATQVAFRDSLRLVP